MRILALLLLLLVAATRPLAQEPPALVFSAPPELAASRSRVAAFDPRPLAGIVRTVGLGSPGPPIDVILAAEDSDAARSVPPWVAGYALGNAGLVVLFPARSPVYPHDTLEDVLRHEVAHVLVARAAGGRPVPRWFHEGLAVAVERPWDLEDRSRLVWELMAGPRLTLREIDALFEAGPSAQSRGYSLAAAVVRDFIREHGAGAPAAILGLVRGGEPFDAAVSRVAGRALGAVEDDFWNRQRVWTIWVPLVTSGEVLWLLVIGVAALAVWRRRRQSREIRRRWEEEQASGPSGHRAIGPSGQRAGRAARPIIPVMTSRRFLITGGSQGIGAAIVAHARTAGHQVVFTGRNQALVEGVAREHGATGVVADVASDADNARVVETAVARMGGIDVLINNAGTGYSAEIGSIDMAKMRALFGTNVFGMVDLTNRVAPLMTAQGAGDIVNIASTSGTKGAKGATVYAGSKWAVRGITQCWQAELRPHGIRVMCVLPSEVQTNWMGKTGRNNPNKLYAADIAATIFAALDMPRSVLWPEVPVFANNPWKED